MTDWGWTERGESAALHVALSLRGRVTAAAAADAAAPIVAAPALSSDGVADARLRLTGANSAGGFGLIQVNLIVYGVPGRVHASGRSLTEAVTTAAARLERLLTVLTAAPGSADGTEFAPWPDPDRRPFAVRWPGHV